MKKMKNVVTLRWFTVSIMIIIIFTGLAWLCPRNQYDDFLYAYPGNPFYLQWIEYLVGHGRMITHIPMRFILQAGEPFIYLFKGIFVLVFMTVCTHQIVPFFWKQDNYKNVFGLSLFFACMFLLMFQLFLIFSEFSYAVIISNYIPIILMICFFNYYTSIFTKDENGMTSIQLLLFMIVSFLAGGSHEIVGAMLPMLVIIYVLLKIMKKDIPKWYGIGFVFYLLGFLFLMSSPGNEIRITGNLPDSLAFVKNMNGITYRDAFSSYGRVYNWEWFSQEINWLELGWKRYFYALYRHVFLTTQNTFFTGPGWIPSTGIFQLVFVIFMVLIYRKTKNIRDNKFLIPILFYILSWGMVAIMMFSPLFHSETVSICRVILYIALSMSIYNTSELYHWSAKYMKLFSLLIFLTIAIGISIQVPAIYKARQKYIIIRQIFETAKKEGIKEVIIPSAPQAIWNGIPILTFHIFQPMLTYYGITNVTYTQE